jgi:hypothetical protein
MLEWAGGAYDADAFDPNAVVFDNPPSDGRRRSNDRSVHRALLDPPRHLPLAVAADVMPSGFA